MRNLYLLFVLLFLSSVSTAQTFENIRATAQGDRVIITYDLVGGQPDQTFSVEVYASHDNYQSPIKQVIGDVGPSVKAGTNKTVAWNAAGELQQFRGDITFELRGKPLVLKFSFRSPVVGAKVRKGKSTTIQWQGGTPMQDVKITLHNGDRFITDVAKTLNRGIYEWRIPKDLDKGEGYFLRLTAGEQTVESGKFRVKGKAMVLLKLTPLLAAGAIIPFLGGDSPGPGPVSPEESPLPGPPDPN